MSRPFTSLLMVALAFGVAVLLAGDLGGEVVKITTFDSIRTPFTTKVWIVEEGPTLWIRAGSPSAEWYQRLVQGPGVEIERKGRVTRYRAIPVKEATPGVNALMAAKYGWADWLIGLVRSRDNAVAVRLDPAS
ncbi:MAG TPA: hypothetical protein VKM54_30005 [Myxococcota bacterium]|nr:hypothetical protein [Myxococcota bacterium]